MSLAYWLSYTLNGKDVAEKFNSYFDVKRIKDMDGVTVLSEWTEIDDGMRLLTVVDIGYKKTYLVRVNCSPNLLSEIYHSYGDGKVAEIISSMEREGFIDIIKVEETVIKAW